MSSVSTDYERLLRAQKELAKQSPELRRVRWIAALLMLSPLALLGGHLFAQVAIQDAFAADHDAALLLSGLSVAALGAWQATSPSRRYVALRRSVLAAMLAATIGVGFLYPYLAITSHNLAIASASERTFEIYRCQGRCRFGGYFVHQRANGTTIEGEYVGPAIPYGTVCTTVQRLNGDYGFSWVRVLERSNPARHEIAWPIRREDCFSDKPLSSLKV